MPKFINIQGKRVGRLVKTAERFKIPYYTLWQRIQQLDWPIDKAIKTPVGLKAR